MKLRILSASLTLTTLLTLVIYAGGIKLEGIKCVMNHDEQVQHLSFVEYKVGKSSFAVTIAVNLLSKKYPKMKF